MPQNPSRLRNYVALAATPAVTMSMSSASADITYQTLDVSIDIGKLSDEVATSVFNIGGYGSASLVVVESEGDWAWALRRSEDQSGSIFFAHRPDGGLSNLVRFESGEMIGFSAFKSSQGSVGNWLGGGSSAGDFPVDFKVEDGTGSGYVGFALYDAKSSLSIGWLSVNWDDATQILSLDGYAYETDFFSGIVAGAGLPPAVPAAPGALGLVALAAGAAGVRRQRAC